MESDPIYSSVQPTRASINALPGATLLQFGTNWCGYCARAEPLIEKALAGHPGIRRVKVEDAKGEPLGRSFAVTLWPTLIVLKDGKEVARLVRPGDVGEIEAALNKGV